MLVLHRRFAYARLWPAVANPIQMSFVSATVGHNRVQTLCAHAHVRVHQNYIMEHKAHNFFVFYRRLALDAENSKRENANPAG